MDELERLQSEKDTTEEENLLLAKLLSLKESECDVLQQQLSSVRNTHPVKESGTEILGCVEEEKLEKTEFGIEGEMSQDNDERSMLDVYSGDDSDLDDGEAFSQFPPAVLPYARSISSISHLHETEHTTEVALEQISGDGEDSKILSDALQNVTEIESGNDSNIDDEDTIPEFHGGKYSGHKRKRSQADETAMVIVEDYNNMENESQKSKKQAVNDIRVETVEGDKVPLLDDQEPAAQGGLLESIDTFVQERETSSVIQPVIEGEVVAKPNTTFDVTSTISTLISTPPFTSLSSPITHLGMFSHNFCLFNQASPNNNNPFRRTPQNVLI